MKPETVWRQFTAKLRDNSLSEKDCRPIDGYCHGLYILRPEATAARRAIEKMPTPRWEYGEDRLMFFVHDKEAIPLELRVNRKNENHPGSMITTTTTIQGGLR